MTIDLNTLEATAKAATPGPWVGHPEDVYSDVGAHVAFCPTVCSSAPEHCISEEQAESNAAYIAVANPAVMLELVAELRKARAAQEWIAQTFLGIRDACAFSRQSGCLPPGEADCVKCWIKAARDAVEDVPGATLVEGVSLQIR